MKDEPQYNLEEDYSKRTSRAFNLFWGGFIIYTTCYTVMITGVVPAKIAYLQLLGMILFLIPTIHLIRLRIENSYLRVLYLAYFCWLIYIVSRGFKFNYEYLFGSFIEAYSGIFLYLAPLILLFPKNLIYIKKVITVIVILSVIYILCDIVFIKALLASESDEGKTVIEYFAKILAIPSGFVLLTIVYNNDERKFWGVAGKVWALSVIVLTFLFAAIRARRGLMFMALDILAFTYIIYNYVHKTNLFFKFFPVLIIFFVSIYALNVYTEKKSGAFSLITERLKEDTRSDVEDYFYIDMEKNDWMIGRGIDGIYYCPTGATEFGYREVIETDYLQIMLKGGWISLGLLGLIAVPAMFLGFFYSKNTLSKAAAFWILQWAISLFPATVTTFSLNYLLVWISIGICYSKEIRRMPEEVVKKYFQYRIF